MSRGRKTGGVSDAAAIPPGVPNATSFVLGPLSCRYIRRARDVFRVESSSVCVLARPTHIDEADPLAAGRVSAPT
jgi:hypothetical protein